MLRVVGDCVVRSYSSPFRHLKWTKHVVDSYSNARIVAQSECCCKNTNGTMPRRDYSLCNVSSPFPIIFNDGGPVPLYATTLPRIHALKYVRFDVKRQYVRRLSKRQGELDEMLHKHRKQGQTLDNSRQVEMLLEMIWLPAGVSMKQKARRREYE